MISFEEKKYILSKAYVPEHLVNLMVPISRGEPFLIHDYVCFAEDEWIIFIGYPLNHYFSAGNLSKALDSAVKRFRSKHIWLIAPEIKPTLTQFCQERESDHYYKLELHGLEVKKDLIRLIRRASAILDVEKGRKILKRHKELISEFIKRENLNPRIRKFLLSMQEFVSYSKTSVVLNAWDKKKNLSAFYVVELAAKEFATYVVGCRSKKNYIPGSSDLLFSEMVNLAREQDKSYVHLGLGVNEGIRKFKEKWGGVPFLKYEFCEYATDRDETLRMLRALASKL